MFPSLACPASRCHCCGCISYLGACNTSCGCGAGLHGLSRRQQGPQVCQLLHLGWGKLSHVQPSNLGLPFFCMLFLDLLEKRLLFVNGLGPGWNRFLPPFFSSSYASIFFCKEGDGFIHLLQGLQVSVLMCDFSKCVDALDCSHS